MRLRRRSLSAAGRAAAYRVASVALRYPDDDAAADLALAHLAAAELEDASLRDRLVAALGTLLAEDPRQRAETYVATFDLRRRTTLHLTWYSDGDTRERGMALAAMKAGYRAAGFELSDAELPDHLAVMLEFASLAVDAGETLLRQHRAPLELLRRELDDPSPYQVVLDVVCDTLGGLAVLDTRVVERLLASGPPAEMVGLEPYGPPEYMGMP
ncbi:MAG TPA: nitrate reductase molybdenum cofactor assembly chaperone [Acidimicrobiales bacterium]|nr:nitrate reductase molybdenum cofactor assembly chaperone [Acidimicrobiales bacterium]